MSGILSLFWGLRNYCHIKMNASLLFICYVLNELSSFSLRSLELDCSFVQENVVY